MYTSQNNPLLDDLLQKLQTADDKTKQTAPYDSRPHTDKTRSKIAMIFVICYFALIVFTLLSAMIYDVYFWNACDSEYKCLDQLISVKDLLLAVMGYVGTPLGFVIGYYFKEQSKK